MQRAFALLRDARFVAPLSCAAAVAQVRAESGFDFSGARARSGFARGHRLDIVIYVPGGQGAGAEAGAAEDLVRLVVGGELFERWVGTVSTTPSARGGPLAVINTNPEEQSALPVETLPETLHAAIAGLRVGLPPLLSSARDSDDWLLFELEPEPAPDFAAQDDLVLCVTRLPELKKSFLRGEPFFSGRFCNSGVLFVYLKYESSDASLGDRLEERTRFEAVVSEALAPEQATLVGVGLGIRYAYLDLAVADPECVRERLMPALRAAKIPQRAWFLFCDVELELEYLSLYPDSPEPILGWE